MKKQLVFAGDLTDMSVTVIDDFDVEFLINHTSAGIVTHEISRPAAKVLVATLIEHLGITVNEIMCIMKEVNA
jgi:hypothetical protein